MESYLVCRYHVDDTFPANQSIRLVLFMFYNFLLWKKVKYRNLGRILKWTPHTHHLHSKLLLFVLTFMLLGCAVPFEMMIQTFGISYRHQILSYVSPTNESTCLHNHSIMITPQRIMQ